VLAAAAASLAVGSAGVRYVIQGDSTPSMTGAVTSATGVAHGQPRAVSKAAAAPAVPQAKPAARQQKPAPSQVLEPRHAQRRTSRPKSRLPKTPPASDRRLERAHARRHHHRHHQQQSPPPHSVALMLLDHAVLDMEAAGASPKLLAFLDRPQNLVSTPLARAKPLANATRIQVFNSYAGIVQALASHHIAADTRAVVYDNERSTGTPAAELAAPVRYCHMAATLLHQHGLEYIASPGFDLSGPQPANGEWFRQFVRAGLMNCARHADYLDIQDQLKQGTSSYARDAKTAAGLLHQITPRAKLLMGLSTSPSGRLDSASQLWQAYQDTSRFVSGYWLNVPHNVAGHSRPSVALHFLQTMVAQTRTSRGS
jgi:hypothetical protein